MIADAVFERVGELLLASLLVHLVLLTLVATAYTAMEGEPVVADEHD